jgi:hypothetical protein
MMNFTSARSIAMAGSVAAVTVVGSVCGAMLRTDNQAREVRTKALLFSDRQLILVQDVKKTSTVSSRERIASLEARKRSLLVQKADLEAKLKALESRSKGECKPGGLE